MYGVVRFLDTELLPASAPNNYPKVIKSGVDEEGQHPESPPIEAQCGLATLLYRMDRMDILEKMLDTKAVQDFDMRVHTGSSLIQDIYTGFIGPNGEEAWHGVRFLIIEEPEESPYRFGKWIPLSMSDLGSAWGGSDFWIRAHGESIAKSIVFHMHEENPISVSFSGMPSSFEDDLKKWNEERKRKHDEKIKKWKELQEDGDVRETLSDREEFRRWLKRYQLRCRGGCGVVEGTLRCSKCQVIRYCSKQCQVEDWKYHKSICGLEKSHEHL
ncbi:hypothetical protein PC9H_004301 [Pleurotus ostreatus]|uniref:MYND-type domain-containing protein n=1 Tax=Pleurotus ostreatus TaxID=5322 RepID=A0A8H7A426_PLEOS|nr:uncharacterized protein PC9H_004301 [Pleurotus ostreatus]KAF7437461.1 hypothetical protein PC9H_004301 [Pleurotus ostreatus]